MASRFMHPAVLLFTSLLLASCSLVPYRCIDPLGCAEIPPGGPIVIGVINIQGRVVPVVDLRKRFHLPERAVDPEDHFIVARSSTGVVALPVDEAEGLVRDLGGQRVAAAEIVPDLNYVDQVFLMGPEMVFVLAIDTVLTDEEELLLADSLLSADVVRD